MKRILVVTLGVLAILAVLVVRVVVGGELAIMESTEALLKGDPRAAVNHAKVAALYYAPGAPHVRVAYGRLFAIARAAEERRDPELALHAYRAIRTASLSTRWIVVPHDADRQAAERAIARLDALSPRPPEKTLETPEAFERSLLEKMSERPTVDRGWAVALVGSFVGMIAGAWLLLRRGIDEAGRLALARSKSGFFIFGLGLVLWVAAAYFA